MNKVYQIIQDRIIKQLEEAIQNGGTAPWQKPWIGSNRAVNYVTRKEYRGINYLLLDPGEYITYTQLQELRKKDQNIKFKKGVKKHMVIFWCIKENKKEDEKGTIIDSLEQKQKTNKQTTEKYTILRYYTVYNIADIKGLKSKFKQVQHSKNEQINIAEEIIEEYNRQVSINMIISNEAYYVPKKDYIVVPLKEQFPSLKQFYSTLFHEMIHSTGHETRLNRFNSNEKISPFGSEDYSKEELVAEIGSNMLLSYCGINDSLVRKNSISYLHSWLKCIKEDITLITFAAQKAEKAADFIIQYIETNIKNII